MTLTSRGWRLIRTQTSDGAWLSSWRCPTCWQRYRAARPASKARRLV